MIHTSTHEALKAAYNGFGQALLQWTNGATASAVERTIRDAEQHLAIAKERLRLHIDD